MTSYSDAIRTIKFCDALDSLWERKENDMGGNSGSSEPGLASRPGPTGFDPGRECADCLEGNFPLYGVAPHECFWRKGPEFTIGQSTLVPFTEASCFVPDLEPSETWADFKYPYAAGVYYCPRCHGEEYRAAWNALVERIGEPPADIATCEHGEHR